jgi:hypothetical protein
MVSPPRWSHGAKMAPLLVLASVQAPVMGPVNGTRIIARQATDRRRMKSTA